MTGFSIIIQLGGRDFKSNHKGYTFLEIIILIAVISIAVIPIYKKTINLRETRVKSVLHSNRMNRLTEVLEEYRSEARKEPESFLGEKEVLKDGFKVHSFGRYAYLENYMSEYYEKNILILDLKINDEQIPEKSIENFEIVINIVNIKSSEGDG